MPFTSRRDSVAAALALAAMAQDVYPSRPVAIVAPYPAGGTTDQIIRGELDKWGPVVKRANIKK